MKLSYFLLVLFLFKYSLSGAQNSGENPVSQKVLADMTNAAKNYLTDFEFNTEQLSMVRDTKRKETCKNYLKKLFLPGAIIEVSTLKGTITPYSVDDYLNVVAGYTRKYAIVAFSIDVVPVEAKNIKAVKNKSGEIIGYKGKTTYTQQFCVKKEVLNSDKTHYEFNDFDICEKTTKEISFYYEKRYSPYLGSNIWTFFLGNVKAKLPEDLKTD